MMTSRLCTWVPLAAPIAALLLAVALLPDCATGQARRANQVSVQRGPEPPPTPAAARVDTRINPAPLEAPGPFGTPASAGTSAPIVSAPMMLRPSTGPIVRAPTLRQRASISRSPGGVADAATVHRRFVTAYRDMARARVAGLVAARSLARIAAKAKHRSQALRALTRFRRALQTAFRIGYAVRRRTYVKIRKLSGPAASAALAALAKPGQVTVNETVGGPAAAAFARASTALVDMAHSGAPLIGSGVAVWTGPFAQRLRGLAVRFQRSIAQAASALEDLARALR